MLEANIPADAINGTAHAELKIYPNLLAHVIESIEAIMQRPYGCGEQTISSAYPSLLALRAYKRMGIEPHDIGTKARRYVQAGYERLLNYRATSGGFSYWGRGDADLALTAYALRFLHGAQEFIEVDEGVMREAREWLVKQQRADGTWPAHVWERTEDKRRTAQLTAYIAHILAMANEKETANQTTNNTAQAERQAAATALKRALAFLSTASKEIDEPYLISAYALAAFDAGDESAAQAATAKLRTLVHDEGDVSYWSLETNTPFYGWGLAGRIETTALVLQALFRDCGLRNSDCGLKETDSSNPQSAIRNLQSAGLLFLLRQQDRYGVWYSTQATVNTLDTLTLLLSKDSSSLRQADASSGSRASAVERAEVFVNGRPATTLELPPEDRLANPVTVDLSRFIAPGSNRIEIRRAAAAARASVQVVSSYYVPWTVASRAANHSSADNSSSALRLNVSYDRSAANVGDEITCRVVAERIGFKGYGMLLAEIGLPPGADVDRATLERAMKDSGWSLSQYDVLPDRLIVYLWPQAGGTRFEFKFRPRFGLAARSAPSLLYDYYNPEARVVVAPTKFVVK